MIMPLTLKPGSKLWYGEFPEGSKFVAKYPKAKSVIKFFLLDFQCFSLCNV